VTKKRPGISRFARCLGLHRAGGDGGEASAGGRPVPPNASRVQAMPVSDSAGGVSATSANPSPSADSRTSGRMLLGDGVKRSDLRGSPQGGAASGALGRIGRARSGEEEATVGLEALPEGSSIDVTELPGAQQRPAAVQAALVSPPASSPRLGMGWWRASAAAAPPAPASGAGGAAADGGGTSARVEVEQVDAESPRRQLLRAAFDVWRDHCAEMAWRRRGGATRDSGGAAADGSPRSQASDEDEVQGGMAGCCGQGPSTASPAFVHGM
jgi:hypothetical protein